MITPRNINEIVHSWIRLRVPPPPQCGSFGRHIFLLNSYWMFMEMLHTAKPGCCWIISTRKLKVGPRGLSPIRPLNTRKIWRRPPAPSRDYTVRGQSIYRVQCLASSEILTPHPLTARRRVCTPRLWCGGGHTRWVERGWWVNSSEDARHCSVLYICKYFVPGTQQLFSVPSLKLTETPCWEIEWK